MALSKRIVALFFALAIGAVFGSRANAQDDDADAPPEPPPPALTAIDYSLLKFSHTLDNGKPAMAIAFSADCKRLAAAVDQRILNWDTTTWELQKPLAIYSGRATSAAFSPDGKLFASGCDGDKAQAQIVDLVTGQVTQTITGLKSVTCVAFSPDNSLLAIATRAPSVLIVKCTDGLTLATLKGSLYPVFKLLWTPDGKRVRGLGGGSRPGATVVGADQKGRPFAWSYATDTEYLDWRLSDARLLRELSIANGGPSCDFSSDGKFVAYLGGALQTTEPRAAQLAGLAPVLWGGTSINVWRCPLYAEDPGKPYASAPRRTTPFLDQGWPSVAWSPNSQVIATGDEQGEYLWDYTTANSPFFTLPQVGHGLVTVAFSPNGHILAGSDERSVYIWSLD